jgi:hypothetical protein
MVQVSMSHESLSLTGIIQSGGKSVAFEAQPLEAEDVAVSAGWQMRVLCQTRTMVLVDQVPQPDHINPNRIPRAGEFDILF